MGARGGRKSGETKRSSSPGGLGGPPAKHWSPPAAAASTPRAVHAATQPQPLPVACCGWPASGLHPHPPPAAPRRASMPHTMPEHTSRPTRSPAAAFLTRARLPPARLHGSSTRRQLFCRNNQGRGGGGSPNPTPTWTFFCVTTQTESAPRTAMLVSPADLTALNAYSAGGGGEGGGGCTCARERGRERVKGEALKREPGSKEQVRNVQLCF